MRLARALPKVKAPRYLGRRSWILYWLVFNVHTHFCTSGEPLSGDRAGQWSRRISQKHRLVYEIEETIVKVDVLSAYGHYEDK